MDEIPIGVLLGTLFCLIILSAFFSGSETGLMSLNRYRLKHLAKARHRGALRAQELLDKPDRLIGLILLGNNFVNILASAIATVIAMRLWGEAGIAIATGMLTIVILIFAEVAPKTIAALHPERIAFPTSFVLKPLLTVLYPLVWLTTLLASGVLRVAGISTKEQASQHLSQEELRTVVNEAGAMIPRRHQRMLLSILDLEKVTVEDIMVPRNEVIGIDLDEDIDKINKQLATSQHTRLLVYRGDIDNVVGIIHVRNALHLHLAGRFTKEVFQEIIREAYFVPEGTPLNKQLLNFQREKRRIGLVVDEYGEILGLVTLEDILEEIVGEFTSDPSAISKDIHPQPDGSYLVDGGTNIRQLNRLMHWKLPTSGPRTLSGLIIEHLEAIPEPGTSIMLNNYPVDIVQTKGNMVKVARIHPRLVRPSPGEEH